MKVLVVSCPLSRDADHDTAVAQALLAVQEGIENLIEHPEKVALIDIPDGTKSYVVKVEPVA